MTLDRSTMLNCLGYTEDKIFTMCPSIKPRYDLLQNAIDERQKIIIKFYEDMSDNCMNFEMSENALPVPHPRRPGVNTGAYLPYFDVELGTDYFINIVQNSNIDEVKNKYKDCGTIYGW